MKKDVLLRIWVDYKDELSEFERSLDWITYTPYKSIQGQSDTTRLDVIEEKFFLLPKEYDFLPPEEHRMPVNPPQVAELPEEPHFSQLPFEAENDDFAYEIGKKLGNLVSSAIRDDSKKSGGGKYFTPAFVDDIREYAGKVAYKRDEKIKLLNNEFKKALENYGAINSGFKSPSPEANVKFLEQVNYDYQLPSFLKLQSNFVIDTDERILLIHFDFPNYSKEVFFSEQWGRNGKFLPVTLVKKLKKQCLYSMIIRYAFLGAKYKMGNFYDSVAVNVEQDWVDAATGQPRRGIIASLFSKCDELIGLNLGQIDAEACFKYLKGISLQALEKPTAIRPIFVLDKDDDRLVDSKNIDEHTLENSNLAAMDWEDFEHLVAQLFEWEFAKDGVEVKVTRASRDRGVDAILFDPNPLRGGKYVLQAKRYTRTVDVSAVRDLYGTVMNEGANRGILITTASFGPDAYEFAKDKPLSLVDGQNLLVMLQKHGKKFRIDLAEARQQNFGSSVY
jgi:restriction system protein